MADQPTDAHLRFVKVTIRSAKCDRCERRNTSVMQKCCRCGLTTCRECHEARRYDDRHRLDRLDLDWQDEPRTRRRQQGLRDRTNRSEAFSGAHPGPHLEHPACQQQPDGAASEPSWADDVALGQGCTDPFQHARGGSDNLEEDCCHLTLVLALWLLALRAALRAPAAAGPWSPLSRTWSGSQSTTRHRARTSWRRPIGGWRDSAVVWPAWLGPPHGSQQQRASRLALTAPWLLLSAVPASARGLMAPSLPWDVLGTAPAEPEGEAENWGSGDPPRKKDNKARYRAPGPPVVHSGQQDGGRPLDEFSTSAVGNTYGGGSGGAGSNAANGNVNADAQAAAEEAPASPPGSDPVTVCPPRGPAREAGDSGSRQQQVEREREQEQQQQQQQQPQRQPPDAALPALPPTLRNAPAVFERWASMRSPSLGAGERARQWAIVEQLAAGWTENPEIRRDREANGPLSALEMLETAAGLEAMRQGLPLRDAFWTRVVRGLREELGAEPSRSGSQAGR
ncbi:hypothetical protein GGR56DRAFT_672831 [Xylariaceae sp. FL0804]|nr:hypothetical protein GGR56DRAFT_672831 [Xylariaceae sp. FL0804]